MPARAAPGNTPAKGSGPKPPVGAASALPRVLGSDAARAVGRFREDGPLGYVAASAPGAVLRATRAEAEDDERAWLDRAR